MLFQSTRPRGREQQKIFCSCSAFGVSIHAPSRARTAIVQRCNVSYLVSIHAPSRARTTARNTLWTWWSSFNPRALAGANSSGAHRAVLLYGFQSTRPRGRERGPCSRSLCRDQVSIHAPSRARTGDAASLVDAHGFQSTRPRGRERSKSKPASDICGFNPRALAGANLLIPDAQVKPRLFQSTRPRGREPAAGLPARPVCKVSIHAPSRARTGQHI